MLYTGVGREAGLTVRQEDAFSYACERCLNGTIEEQETFLELAQNSEDIEQFSEMIMEWFYSENWTKSVGDEYV
ncbi:MAG: hypothetical protein QM793_15020 [Muricomes sp.]